MQIAEYARGAKQMEPRRGSSPLQTIPIGDPHAPIETPRIVRSGIPLRAATAEPPHIFDQAESAALGNRLANLRSELDRLQDDVNELLRKREGPF